VRNPNKVTNPNTIARRSVVARLAKRWHVSPGVAKIKFDNMKSSTRKRMVTGEYARLEKLGRFKNATN